MFLLFLLSQITLCVKNNGQNLIKGERVDVDTSTEPRELNQKEYAYIESLDKQGGAVRSSKTNITLSQCKFTSIKSKQGGAIYIYMTKINKTVVPLYCNIVGCQFISCSASQYGGAAYLENTQPNAFTFNIEGCTFTSNEAPNGGAIYGKIRDEYVMKDCTFTNNKASVNGSSLCFIVGNKNGKDANDTVILLNNQFLVGSDSASNVYIQNNPVDQGISAHAHIIIGDCTFGAENPTNPNYKNLELVACPVGFENISFISCNCFKQGVNSLTIPSKFLINNIDFECNSLDTCSPDTVEQPTPPPDTPTSLPKPDPDGYTPSERIVSEKDKEIKLNKYKFTNPNTENVDGGAIYISSNRVNCILNNCKFDSCHGNNGGALYVYYAKVKSLLELKVSDCEFTNCEASVTGGAIYIKTTQSRHYNLLISSSIFRNNKAATNGGALCLLVRDNFTMKDCTFENNEAHTGSSIWCQIGWDDNATENNTDNTAIFLSNTFSFTPKENSINVYIQSHNVDITKLPRNAVLKLGQSRFTTNGNANLEYKHLVISNNGDGFQSISFPSCICVDKDKNTVTLPQGISDDAFTYNCKSYDSCKPDSDGYRFHDRIKDESREGPINLESYKFNSLSDGGNGGAISIDSFRISCTIKKCKFESCTANKGGAIYIYYIRQEDTYVCTITETDFISNEASSYGGALYCEITQADRHSVSVSYCTFKSNKAKSGGAINANARDSFSLEHCTFEDNVATGGIGCSLWCRVGWYDRYTENTAIIRDNTFIFTPVNDKSINVYIESNYLNEDVSPNANLTFGGNVLKATNNEVNGYLHIKIKAPSEFEVLNFDHCNCIQQGPETVNLPYSYGSPLPYFGFNCQNHDICSPGKAPEGPKPDADGYTAYDRLDFNVESTIRLTKSKFTNVQSKYSGGAVSLVKVSSVMKDCKFESCKSTYSNTKNGGGAIYVSYTGKESAVYSFFISGCTFNKCEAYANGGAVTIIISQAKRHSAIIEECTFTQNKATKNGGGIYAEGRDLFTVRYCTFTNNEAVNGSSLWCTTGWYNGNSEKNNAFQLFGNTFSFQANKPTSNNVYIKNTYLQEGINPNANVYIGRCQFYSSNLNQNGQRHLIIEEVGTYQSIQFTECNCVQGNEKTVEINVASKPDLSNGIKFNCNKMDECTSGSEVPPPSDGCNYQGRQEAFKAEIKKENNCFYNLFSAEGGAARAINAKLELKNCKFNNCTSGKDGGAVYAALTASNYQFHLISCTFENCNSGRRGGAVFFDNQYASKSSITSCVFTNNKADFNGGALYYAPCANSLLSDCLFENNTVNSNNNAHGSSVYVLIKNLNSNTASKKLRITEESEDNVVIKGNIIKSEPTANGRQMYIILKQTGKLELGSNSFSFNDAEKIPEYSRFLQLVADKGADVSITGEICLDSDQIEAGLISGIDSNIRYNCKPEDMKKDKKKSKSNVGLIVGVTIAAVVVVVVVIVVVVIVLKRRKSGQYVSDLADDDNQTGPNTTDAEYGASAV